jgi:hypothetical protein
MVTVVTCVHRLQVFGIACHVHRFCNGTAALQQTSIEHKMSLGSDWLV